MRARARGLRRPREGPSLGRVVPAFPGLSERVAGARDHVADRVHGLARLVAVVAPGGPDVIRQWRRFLTATLIFALQDPIVLAALDPALQLAGAHRRERMRAKNRVDELPDLVPRA